VTATIRPPRPEDQGYIAKTWSRSMLSAHAGGHAIARHGAQRTAPVSKGQRRQDLLTELNRRIDVVLDRPDTRALVAVQPGNGGGGARDYILAWVVYVDAAGVPIVHYAYTRDHDDTGETLRGRGLVRAIFERVGIARDTPVICTSDGPSSAAMRDHFRASTYYPLDQFLTPTRRP
jgi:hypothetical protein